jgi:hypothetical protein
LDKFLLFLRLEKTTENNKILFNYFLLPKNLLKIKIIFYYFSWFLACWQNSSKICFLEVFTTKIRFFLFLAAFLATENKEATKSSLFLAAFIDCRK